MRESVDVVDYQIPIDKLAEGVNKRIALLADLHDIYTKKGKLEELKEALAKMQPELIIISGDIMQSIKYVSSDSIDELKYFLSSISEIAPVVISQGNHDIAAISDSQKEQLNKAFMGLDSARPGEVYPLINDCIIINGMEIISYVTTHKIMASLSTQLHGVAHDEFIRDFNENGLYRFTNKDGNINIFVGHNPHLIAASENGVGLGDIADSDLIVSGHLHNGYMRSEQVKKNPDKYLDKGYVEQPYVVDASGKVSKINPLFYGKSNLCRGCVYVDENSRQVILQLRNGHYYLNLSEDQSKQDWILITKEEAVDIIMKHHYSALVISGGINKFFSFSVPGDKPEIDNITLTGMKK